MKRKILVVTKHPDSKGGVVNYYNHFFKVFKDDKFELEWFVIGSRPEDYDKRRKRNFSYALEFIKDIFNFIIFLRKDKSIEIVQVSPSFMPVPMLRDSIYLFISRLFKKKTITFIRGWSTKFENSIKVKSGLYKYVVKYYNKSNKILVLAEKFKITLSKFGFNTDKIEVTRTMYVDDDIQTRKDDEITGDLKFLYIGRLSFQKGMMDIIEGTKILNEKGVTVDVEIFGHYADKDIEAAMNKKITEYNLLNQIKINSFISGKEKYEKLANADVFIFPTYHDEGCPNSIIEALASSLFVLSTPIGAIDELVVDKEHGFILPIKSPDLLSEKMKWCIDNIQNVRQIGSLNSDYAYANFEQNILLDQIKKIYCDLLQIKY